MTTLAPIDLAQVTGGSQLPDDDRCLTTTDAALRVQRVLFPNNRPPTDDDFHREVEKCKATARAKLGLPSSMVP